MSQPAGLAGHTRWEEEVLVTGWEGGEETGKMARFLNRKSAVQGVSFQSHQPLLISFSSVSCHVVLLAELALSY